MYAQGSCIKQLGLTFGDLVTDLVGGEGQVGLPREHEEVGVGRGERLDLGGGQRKAGGQAAVPDLAQDLAVLGHLARGRGGGLDYLRKVDC